MMETLKALGFIISVSWTILFIGSFSIEGQIIGWPCTASMINNFTPCFNIITGSSSNNNNSNNNSNGSLSQKENCCTTLRWLSELSMDCACVLLTANVPVPLPINAALSLILPTSCNITNLPPQCKSSVSPLPSPGPISLGPISPTPSAAAYPLSPQAKSESREPQQLSATYPDQVESQLAPPPTHHHHHQILPVLSPSPSASSCFRPSSLLLISIAMVMVFKARMDIST